jgi:hypothetical protein
LPGDYRPEPEIAKLGPFRSGDVFFENFFGHDMTKLYARRETIVKRSVRVE